MKKLIFLFLFSILTFSFAQSNAAAIKLGFYKPSATDGGFIIGYEGGKHIDEALDVCWSVDWFKKDFEDTSALGDSTSINGNLHGDDSKLLAETTIYSFPVMLSLTAKFPLANKTKWFLTGGFGAEMLYASYHKFADGVVDEEWEHELAFDWNWRLGAGILYNLGTYSELFFETTWHYSVPSFDYEFENEDGDTFTGTREYDMMGILARVGVRYYF